MAKRILHVEDDEDTCRLVKTILGAQGYTVISAFSGGEALDKLREGNFNLVLLDVMLPDMSGWDILYEMRGTFYSARVAFLSAMHVSDNELRHLKEDGISDYITKPFNNEDLVRRIRNILEIKKSILHVEDDEDTRNLVKTLLEFRGYRVMTASCGREGLDRLREDIDLVLLDVMLPDISGWTVFNKIRSNLTNKNLKVAFLSVVPISDEQLADLEGVHDYITKPFDTADLVRRIDNILWSD